MLRRYRLLALVAAALAVLTAGCSSPAKPAASAAPHRLADCAGKPQLRPSEVAVRCADNSLTADHLTWSGWGTPVATATGVAVINTCEFQECHTGAYATYHVVLVVSGALNCPKGGRAYARIQYMFVGHFNAWPAGVTDQVIARPCGRIPPARDHQPRIPKSSNA
jgi:hypothetical protein